MTRKSIVWFCLILLAVGLSGCNDSVEPPSAIISPADQPETPRGLTASIGDGQVDLAWTVNTPTEVSQYKIYFSDSAQAAENMSFLDSTENTTYRVDGLVNGRIYYFRVSAVDNSGLEGEMSRSAVSQPGVFSINLETGRLYHNERLTTVNLTVPESTDLMQLAEDSFFVGAHWENFTPITSFEVSDGDGTKHVYARFQTNAGGMSIGHVSDSIILDRIAIIDSVTENSGGSVLSAGDTVHFSIYTAEAGGTAAVSIQGLLTIELNDFGSAGDMVAFDGIYGIDYIIPIGTELVDAEVLGSFTDPARNQAPQIKAETRLNAAFPPDPVQLTGYGLSSSEILLEWTRSEIDDFASYRLFRDDNASVDQNSLLITTISSQSTLTYNDTDLDDETDYFYRLYVFDANGQSASSDSIQMQTLFNDPPDPIIIAGNLTGDTLTVEISWLEASDDDFKAYHIMRDIVEPTFPVTYDSDLVLKIINGRVTTSFIDKVPAADIYYYTVFVFDEQGKSTGSNFVAIAVP